MSFIYLIPLYIYLFIFMYGMSFCEKITINDLKNIVTKKDTLGWLQILNDSENSHNPYCHLCCITVASVTTGKHCGSHTLCKYPTNNTSPACKGFLHIGFSDVEKEALLDAHNTLRNIVASGKELRGSPGPQPSAANMRALEWNDELALIAERWAAQCIYSHDICRDLERFPVGQIMAHGNLATNNELSFVKAWYDEVKRFNKNEVDSFKIPKADKHVADKYTQLVWADTYQIGCARAVFQTSKGFQVNYREHLICNYGPTGNIPNQPVYITGTPCTSCHEGTSCMLEYPALCGVEMINKINEEVHEPKIGAVIEGDVKEKQIHKPKKSGCGTNFRQFLFQCVTFILYTIVYDGSILELIL